MNCMVFQNLDGITAVKFDKVARRQQGRVFVAGGGFQTLTDLQRQALGQILCGPSEQPYCFYDGDHWAANDELRRLP